jgi:hypothetical protein
LARVTQAATPKQFNLLACVSMASSIKKNDILVLVSHVPAKKK